MSNIIELLHDGRTLVPSYQEQEGNKRLVRIYARDLLCTTEKGGFDHAGLAISLVQYTDHTRAFYNCRLCYS